MSYCDSSIVIISYVGFFLDLVTTLTDVWGAMVPFIKRHRFNVPWILLTNLSEKDKGFLNIECMYTLIHSNHQLLQEQKCVKWFTNVLSAFLVLL